MNGSVVASWIRYFKLHTHRLSYYTQKLPKIIPGQPEVVISFTTLPHRIHKIEPMINSVLDQTVRPTRIFLNLPEKTQKGKKYVLPGFIEDNSFIAVRVIKKDLGPATKLLPTLESEPAALIVVVDDDQVYPVNLIENYLRYHQEFPDEALTLCGWKVPEAFDHSRRQILRGAGLSVFDPNGNITEPQHVDILQGASSYMVQRRFFRDDLFDYKGAPEGAFYSDDIWISGQLALNGVGCKVIPASSAYIRMELAAMINKPSLLRTVNRDGQNNSAVYEYFRSVWNQTR